MIRLALQQFGIIVSKDEQKCNIFVYRQLPGRLRSFIYNYRCSHIKISQHNNTHLAEWNAAAAVRRLHALWLRPGLFVRDAGDVNTGHTKPEEEYFALLRLPEVFLSQCSAEHCGWFGIWDIFYILVKPDFVWFQGNLKDFQLWVISKRDNVPYPLIGQWDKSSLSLWVECNIILNEACDSVMRCFYKNTPVTLIPTVKRVQTDTPGVDRASGGLTLPPLCIRSWVPLQYPYEPREAHGVSAQRRQSAPCRQRGGKARGEAAGAQAVPIHSETSTHRNGDYVWRWTARPPAILFFFF